MESELAATIAQGLSDLLLGKVASDRAPCFRKPFQRTGSRFAFGWGKWKANARPRSLKGLSDLLCGEFFGLDVVAEDDVLLAEVELAIDDDGVGPTGAFAAAGGFEGRDFGVVFGGGFDEGDGAVLEMEVEVTIGRGDGGAAFAGAALFPNHIAGHQLSAEWHTGRIGIRIDVVPNHGNRILFLRETEE